jgi:hypothetical protein
MIRDNENFVCSVHVDESYIARRCVILKNEDMEGLAFTKKIWKFAES